MLKVLFLVLFTNLFCVVYSQQPTSISGMRGVPLNLPDISVVGNFYSEFSKSSQNFLNIKEIELAFQGYVYPKLYSNVIFAYHEDEFELEEAYLNFANIFKEFSLEIGKRFLDFGKINKIHPHHRAYFDEPQVIKSYLGEHGLLGIGYKLSYVLPLKFFTQLSFGIYDISKHQHKHQDDENHEFSLTDKSYVFKLWCSFPLGDLSELEVAVNNIFSKGPDFKEHKDEITLLGLDLSYKHILSTYKSLKMQCELFYLIREIPLGKYNRVGGYFYAGYILSRYWNLGLRFDFVETPDIKEQDLEKKETTSSVSYIVTRNLTETTYVRAQYKYVFEENNHIGYLQMVFGFGPHSHMLE